MRVMILAPLLLAGCAMSPQRMAQYSDWNVCRYSMTPAQGEVAAREAMRRGLDCRAYYPAIQAQQANENAATANLLRQLQPAQAPMPITNCRTVRLGNSLETQCF